MVALVIRARTAVGIFSAVPPNPPGGVGTLSILNNDHEIDVNWTGAIPTTNAVKDYDIYFSTTGELGAFSKHPLSPIAHAGSGAHTARIGGLPANTDVWVKLKTRDVQNIESLLFSNADSSTTAAPQLPPNSVFIDFNPSVTPAIPGGTGYAMGSGYAFRNGNQAHTTIPTTIFIDSDENVGLTQDSVNPPIFRGGVGPAYEHNVENCIRIHTASGRYDAQTRYGPAQAWEVFGHNSVTVGWAVPTHGLLFVSSGYIARGGSAHIMGIRSWSTDAFPFTEPFGSGRSTLNIVPIGAAFSAGITRNMLISGCEGVGAIDQSFNVGFTDPTSAAAGVNTTYWECAILESLHNSIHELVDGDPSQGFDGGHSCGAFIDHTVKRFSMGHCIMSNNAGRNPFTCADENSIVNNLFYQWGCRFNAPTYGSECIVFVRHSSDQTPASLRGLVANNLFVRGIGTRLPIAGDTFSGNQLRVVGNRHHGVDALAPQNIQDDLVETSMKQYLVGTTPLAALTDGLTNDAANSDSIGTTNAEKKAFIDKIEKVAGPQPKGGLVGRMQVNCQFARNSIDGISPQGFVPDTFDEVGGYPSPIKFSINPNNPTHVTQWWNGDSLPPANIWHTINLATNRTFLEDWVLRRRAQRYGL